jgi:hypothetical protein
MKDAAIAIFSAIIGFCLSRWQSHTDRNRFGRDAFISVTADLRAKLDDLAPADFIIESIPILRPAIYRVRPYAKDWTGLQSLWQEFESKYKTQRQKDTEETEFRLDVAEALRKRDGGKTAVETLADYLDKFDDYVA